MKSYIPHRLFVINDQIVVAKYDDTISRCYQLAFEWANKMGLEGKKVFSLHLQIPNAEEYSPMNNHSSMWCKIECTLEEREHWEEIQKLNIQHAVHEMLKE